MSLWRMVLKEISFRAGHSLMALCAVTVAVGAVTGARSLLGFHDTQERALLDERESQTRVRLESLENTVRQAMDRLGFNVMILPEGQNLADWYAEDYAARTMDESAAARLRAGSAATLEKPVAQLRQKIKWPETRWTVILIGTEGRILKSSASGNVEAVPPGSVWVGHEIHRGLGLKPGAAVQIMGKEFRIDRCLDTEGSNEDITLWMPLAAAQELLGKKGMINEILAVEKFQVRGNLPAVKKEVAGILPGARVVEQTSKTVTRLLARLNTEKQVQAALAQERDAQARLAGERVRLAWLLNALVLLICAAWVGLLAFNNAGERKVEIGTWHALGWRFPHVVFLFGVKWLVLGFVGGLAGFVGGIAAGVLVGVPDATKAQMALILSNLDDPATLGVAMAVALGLTVVGSWIPVAVFWRQDPAVVLQEG